MGYPPVGYPGRGVGGTRGETTSRPASPCLDSEFPVLTSIIHSSFSDINIQFMCK